MSEGSTDSTPEIEMFLRGLNANQRIAVTSPANGRLQIIAGPGTGKTKVLISRVAYLLLHERIKPEHIIVTTFTKKAANEMVDRLGKMLGNTGDGTRVVPGTSIELEKLLIGTFHSICFRIIKKFGHKVGLGGFTIADERDKDILIKEMFEKNLSDTVISHLKLKLKEDAPFLMSNKPNEKYFGVDIPSFKRQIGKLKARGYLPETYLRLRDYNQTMGLLYRAYQNKLSDERKLDFDDCLLSCYKLVTRIPVLHHVRHVLVDEFQDTNEIQLQLMYEFAKGDPLNLQYQHNVTLVGDPDQSIYAFREAQSNNFHKMKEHYTTQDLSCSVVSLTENYRSTKDILDFSERVMTQQPDRILKNLNSQCPHSFKPVYLNLSSAAQEASWIAYQIDFLQQLPHNPIKYDEISILVRAAYQTRAIEAELVRKRIPYIMVRGKAFWERKEVTAIMDYLRVCGEPNDRIAILQTLNYPKRGFGAVTLEAIDRAITTAITSSNATSINTSTTTTTVVDDPNNANNTITLKDANNTFINKRTKKSARDVLRGLLESNNQYGVKLPLKAKESLKGYIKMIDQAQVMLDNLEKEEQIDPLKVARLFDQIYTDSGLKKEYEGKEKEEVRLNVEEVKTQFCEFTPQSDLFMEEVTLDEIEESNNGKTDLINSTNDDLGENFIRKFVESVGLYEDDKTGDEKKKKKVGVAISTIHGSKGLEWPVVFVPGLSEGLLPAGFALTTDDPNSLNEERRCFYVASTRAKTLLFISSYIENEYSGSSWRKPIDTVSRFLKAIDERGSFVKSLQFLAKDGNLEALYTLLGKELVIQRQFDKEAMFSAYKLNWLKQHETSMANFEIKFASEWSKGSLPNQKYRQKFDEYGDDYTDGADLYKSNARLLPHNQERKSTLSKSINHLSSVIILNLLGTKRSKAPTYIPDRKPLKKKFKSLHTPKLK